MQPGLRRVASGTAQLTPAAAGSRHQREKLAVLSSGHAAQALLVRDGFDAAPALDALCSAAAREHPDVLGWDGARAEALGAAVAGGTVEQRAGGSFGLGDEIARCLHALPPQWRLAALLSLAFVEDFAVVDGSDGTVPWLAVCLPSHWAPETKVGRRFAEVHAPVADNALIVGAGAALTKLVTGSERWERFVWTVTPHARLHAHPDRVDPARWSSVVAGDGYWRTERQSFIAVPGRQQALFTIAVDVQPLADAIDSPDKARKLHDALASMSPAVLDYRGLAPVRDPLLAWLSDRTAA